MTEAMSRHEIEDVLSSIRRLVSHDDRKSPSPVQTTQGPGKLVLTSALRVDDGEGARPPADPDLHGADQQPSTPLLTRITQAGQSGAGPDNVMPTPSITPAPAQPQESPSATEMTQENALEATLTRLEDALSVSASEPDSAGETVIDEEVLAQVVERIVRQELQGELGERITRNIRKLVRAEVARELQMRNL